MNRLALSTMIAQLGGVPSIERMAILQEVADALVDRIESLERQVRSLRLQQRPFKTLMHTFDADDEAVGHSNATLNESRQNKISAAGGKSVNRTPVKRFDTEHRKQKQGLR